MHISKIVVGWSCVVSCITFFVLRIHAGIDEMDVFFNIDLNNFLDVSSYMCHLTGIQLLLT